MNVIIEGIPVTITKKDIKNLHLTVKPPDGRVEVSAPKRMSDAAVISFVSSKADWIRRQQANIARRDYPKGHMYVSGETLYVKGRPYTLRVLQGSRSSVEIIGEDVVLTAKPDSSVQKREKLITEWYRSILKAEVAEYLPKWEKITGLHCNSWQSKQMRSRWGTCNTQTGRIWLNVQLAKAEPRCLEYVILHELAHLKVSNHRADFKALLDAFMPEWREVKKRLNGVQYM